MRHGFATMAVALSFTLPLSAQERSVVSFEPGNFGTMITGEITGDAYRDYVLGAGAGQEMFIEMVEGNGPVVYFNILPPGSDGVAIYNSSTFGNSTTVELEESGDYVIRVYQLGNAADTGVTTGYNIDVSIQ